MQSIVFRYGLRAMLAIVVLSAIHFFLVVPNAGSSASEVAGYLTITLSMIFVFMGIRQYRDQVNGGYLSFGQGLKIGFLISIIPSIAFGLFDIIYTEIINPNWLNDYYTAAIEKARLNTPAAELEAELSSLRAQREMFENPFIQFALMAATVLLIGLIISIISSLALRRNKNAAA